MEGNKLHNEIHTKVEEIQTLMAMAKALEQSFAGDYIDADAEDIILAIRLDEQTFRGIFDSLSYMLNRTRENMTELERLSIKLKFSAKEA